MEGKYIFYKSVPGGAAGGSEARVGSTALMSSATSLTSLGDFLSAAAPLFTATFLPQPPPAAAVASPAEGPAQEI